jgi:hypothetical protein
LLARMLCAVMYNLHWLMHTKQPYSATGIMAFALYSYSPNPSDIDCMPNNNKIAIHFIFAAFQVTQGHQT